MAQTSMQAAARRLVELGLGVTPLAPGSKIPIHKDWPKTAINKTLEPPEALEQALAAAFTDGQNIGAVWGPASSDIVDVDLDHRLAVRLAPHLLPATRQYGRKSNPNSHWLYRSPGAKTLKLRVTGDPIANISGMLVELKAAGQQSAIPPSLHPDGECYSWRKGTPKPVLIDAAELERYVRLLGAATVLTALWSFGSRHDLALALAGAMLRSGWTVEHCERLVQAICAAAGDLEIDDRIRAVADTAAALAQGRQAKGLPELARLTDERAVEFLKKALNLGSAIPSGVIVSTGTNLEVDDTLSFESELILVNAGAVKVEPVRWLWRNRFARGALNLIAGEPGVSKSVLTCAITAIVTNGSTWPMDGTPCELGNVLMLNVEDDLGKTVTPRLQAAGANLDRVELIAGVTEPGGKKRYMTLADVDQLEKYLQRSPGRFSLLVCDPVGAIMAGRDSHKDTEVRSLLAPLGQLAMEHDLAVLLVLHFNKPKAGHSGKAMHRVLGSTGYVAASRMAYALVEDPDNEGRLLLLPIKTNLAPKGMGGLGYELESVNLGPDIDMPHIIWHDVPEMRSADTVLSSSGGSSQARDDHTTAKEWLRHQLEGGPKYVKALKEAAADELVASWRTIRRIAEELGVVGTGEKENRVWALPG